MKYENERNINDMAEKETLNERERNHTKRMKKRQKK